MAKRTAWPDKDIETVCRMYGTYPASEIGMAIGKTRNAVLGFLKRHRERLGLPEKGFVKTGRPRAVKVAPPAIKAPAIKAPAIKVPVPVPVPMAAETGTTPFYELAAGQCRYILTPVHAPITYDVPACGAAVATGMSWCGKHARLVYNVPVTAGRKSEKG